MAIRTIDAPGIEIREIDKSQYSPAMTGTKVLVTGFANSGEDYIPMIFTSKSAWLKYYGEPDNEAERYFYAASMEVLNQNGVVNCCKLPYENEARDKFVGQKYVVKTQGVNEIETVYSALTSGSLSSYNSLLSNSISFNRDLVSYFITTFSISDATDKDTLSKASRAKIPSDVKGILADATKVNRTNRTDGKVVGNDENFFDVYADGLDSSEFDEMFKQQVSKGQVATYIRELQNAAFAPKLNAYWMTELGFETSALGIYDEYPLSDDIPGGVQNIISSMGCAVAKSVEWIIAHKENAGTPTVIWTKLSDTVELQYFDEENYLGKKVSELATAIKELSSIGGINGTGVDYGYDPVTVKDYCDVLKYTIDMTNISVEISAQNITQTISVIVANPTDDGGIGTLMLSATNTFLYPRPIDKPPTEPDFIVDEIVDLKLDDWFDATPEHTPEISDDTIWATFTTRDNLNAATYIDYNGMRLRFGSGTQSMELSPTDYESLKDTLEVVSKGRFNLVKTENNFEDAMEYYNLLNSDREKLSEEQVKTAMDALAFSEIRQADETIKTKWEVSSKGTPGLYDLATVDEYRTDESRVGTNEILIVDKTRKPYGKIPEDKSHKNDKREVIGVIPIVTTAANALYAQSLIDVSKDEVTTYEPIKLVQTLDCRTSTNTYKFNGVDYKTFNTLGSDVSSVAVMSKRLNNDRIDGDSEDEFFESLALEANSFFTPIALQADGGFDRENMKKIGVVVVQAYLDATEGNKISFQTVEAFVGSLDRNAKNPNTGATTFIDTLVNEQSQYINVFSNCFPTDSLREDYNNKLDILVVPHETAKVASLGFYEGMCEEDIDISESILKALDIVYDKVTDINEREIDIVVDGGISNIAQFIKTVYGGTKGAFDPISPDAALWKCAKDNDVKMWKTVIQKMDNFCKNIRKDCMFIADGPRPYCLQGQKKIVRPSKPTNTIDANILPYTKYLTGINTSYGAGYCDWFQVADEFSGDYFWCPPSIKACGVYIFTDLNFEYWDAPAGLNRGMVAALDVAFSPTNKQAGQIYTKSWNYAINYPQDGIILEGQRTLQSKPSALDRVNVRRLMLRLERAVYKVLRYVVYEGHTAALRQRVIDLIKPMFEQAKIGGGLYDYKLICDESINTPDVIDRNELKLRIGLKPTKTVEFIEATFTLLNTGASWSEM
jgi:hypothetical protein